jgi:CRP/FNR family transcriptional regulator
MLECVQGLNVFDVLKEEQVMKIAENSKIIELKAGNMLFRPDDMVESIYIIHQGKVKIYKLNEAGKQLTLAYLVPGNIIGEVDIFSMRPRGVFAEIAEDAMLCVINKDYLREIILNYPELTEKMFELVCSRVKELEDDVYNQAICNTRDKIVNKLLNMSQLEKDNSNSKTAIIDITHQELAEMIGSSRETVSLTLKTLENSHYIKLLHGKIKIDIVNLKIIKEKSC